MKSSRSKQSETTPAKKTVKKAAVTSVPKSKNNNVMEISREELALRAYFIGERRRSLGMDGDETSDWVQAEQELSRELAVS
jgi:hypothetical protein